MSTQGLAAESGRSLKRWCQGARMWRMLSFCVRHECVSEWVVQLGREGLMRTSMSKAGFSGPSIARTSITKFAGKA